MNILKYTKALVPLGMALIYFAEDYFGIDIPLAEGEVMMIITFLVWLLPNAKANS